MKNISTGIIDTWIGDVPVINGGCTWTIPGDYPPGSYELVAISHRYGKLRDIRKINIAEPRTLAVTAPVSGEIWETGGQETVRWASTGLPSGDSVEIKLKRTSDSGTIRTWTAYTTTGEKTVTVLPEWGKGTDYQVCVEYIGNRAIKNCSGPFEIGGPSLIVLQPSGGERWTLGSTHAICWTSSGTPPGSKIRVRVASGSSIITDWPDQLPSGSVSWTIPMSAPVSSGYKVWLYNSANPFLYNASQPFGVVSGSLRVTSPNGGEQWTRGLRHPIKWTYSNNPGSTLNITLLKGGTFHKTISPKVSIRQGVTTGYLWTTPFTIKPGSDYRVSIMSNEIPAYWDKSDTDFRIV
ncbi:MAG: GPI anchored serine-threonine rich family protein [Methanoregulaceae archaeon]|nr:GPI anchored serine-threonine rich family protein [Methanoregulaceae archaeon]